MAHHCGHNTDAYSHELEQNPLFQAPVGELADGEALWVGSTKLSRESSPNHALLCEEDMIPHTRTCSLPGPEEAKHGNGASLQLQIGSAPSGALPEAGWIQNRRCDGGKCGEGSAEIHHHCQI